MKGSKALPACVAEYPCTWMRFNGKKNSTLLRAEYRKSVRRLAPAKLRDRNKESENIGAGERASTNRNAINDPTPITAATGVDSIRAKAIPPRPTVARNAPTQSGCARLSFVRQSGTRQNVRPTTTNA